MTGGGATASGLEPFGVEVGSDLRTVGVGEVAGLRALLADHGVVVFPDQQLDDQAFVAFLHLFGPLTFTAGEVPVEGASDLNLVTNVGRDRPPRSEFHTDTSYVPDPPAYTALRAVTIPRSGGATLFADQRRAHDTLPDDLRRRLEGRTIRHVATGVETDDEGADHPILRPHPLTGRTALYLSTPARCSAMSGLPATESAELVARLHAHATDPSLIHAHRWSPGDVVMWDNACVLHRADHDGVVGDRVLHRGMVASYTGTA